MDINIFTQQVKLLQRRLDQLYHSTTSLEEPITDILLPTALKELGTSSEELHVAAEELSQQIELVANLRHQLEGERQRYYDLFELMPDAYLVTDAQGKILEANRAAATLLNIEPSSLQGKLLINFIPLDNRSAFRSQLAQMQQRDWVQSYTISLQPRQEESMDTSVTVAPVRDSLGKLLSLRWILRDITIKNQVQSRLSGENNDPSENRQKHMYFKGDIIPLEPEKLWLVHQGLVKLSTINERGDEVLVGLAGNSMPFGSSLTDLPTYQAIALTQNVELVSISLGEISASQRLAQSLLPQISQRLRQTESLLAISGRRNARERLEHLLLFLKAKFAHKGSQGTRLTIRLTHQELADACCTTRVTITRLLGKLQQKGMIAFDSKNHIIFKDVWSEKYQNAG
ncbi:MAG: PAS domain-containing protein [Cyanobacteriota bacterium]